MKKIYVFTAILFQLCILSLMQGAYDADAEVQMAQEPYWSVGVFTQYPTGIGWGDFDNNGWQDLAATRGLDAVKLPKNIYSCWNGQLDTAASWVSSDVEASDNISIGDIDNDGDLDMLVSHLGITATGMVPLPAVIYFNTGNILSSSPGWYSRPANSFSNALGDVDGDGDLDVAIGQGDWLTDHLQPQVIYRNNNGQIDTVPWWQSDSAYYVDEIAFVDIDNDGDLDLATGHERGGVRIYYNCNGVLETSPSWILRTVVGARQIDFGDVDHNGYPDMVVASPLVGYYLFLNNNGVLDTLPTWSNLNNDQPCCVDLADIDGDGNLDLAAGAWSSPLVIFRNENESFGSDPVWSYNNGKRVEQVCWGDVDGDGWRDTIEKIVGDGNRKLFYLSKTHVCQLQTVAIDGMTLSLSDYCYHLADGWISLGDPVNAGDTLSVSYRYSEDPDLVTSNGTVMIFKNISNIICSISPPDKIISPGETADYTILLHRQYGSLGPIEMETEITPMPDSGSIQLFLNPDTVYANDTIAMNIATNAGAKPGEYIISVKIFIGADTLTKSVTLDILGSGEAAVIGGDQSMVELAKGIWDPVDSLWSVPPIIGSNYQALIIEQGATVGDTAKIRQYIEAGGRVLLTRQTPYELCGNTNITPISGWVGATGYSNYTGSGIPIVATYDQPFGVEGIRSNDTIGTAVYGFGRLSGLTGNGVRIARLGTVNTILAGVYCGSGAGHCFYYTGGAGISAQSDSLIGGFLTNPALGIEECDLPDVNEGCCDISLKVYPNPMRAGTNVSFSLSEPAWVKLEIYDILGRNVRHLANRMMSAGANVISWDGKNNKGEKVANGIYFMAGEWSGKSKLMRLAVVR